MKTATQKKVTVIVLASALSFPCVAAEIDYEIQFGASRNDNIARTETAEIEETIALVGLELDLQHVSKRLELGIATNLEYRNYTDNTFDDEVVGSLNADLFLKLVPDVFSWVFQEQFGNVQTNPFEANTEPNRQDINRFSTGPDLRIRMGSVTSVEIAGRYSANSFEVGDLDSDTLNGQLALVRSLSSRSSLSLNLSADRIEFDDEIANSNYDRQTVFVGFQSAVSRGSLTLNLGYNEIHDNGATFDGSLVGLEWTRDISSSTTFRVAYDQRLSDVADSFGRNQAPGPGFGDVQQTPGVSDPFENNQFSAGVDFSRGGNSLFVAASFSEDEFLTLGNLDRNWTDIRAGVSRTLGSAWQFRLGGSFRKTEFDLSGREDDDLTYGLGLSRQLSRTLGINLDWARNDRDSSDIGFSYVENVINLSFSYSRN